MCRIPRTASSLIRGWAREGEFDGGGPFGERDLGGDGVVVGRHLVPRHADPARRQHGERGGQSDVGGPAGKDIGGIRKHEEKAFMDLQPMYLCLSKIQ